MAWFGGEANAFIAGAYQHMKGRDKYLTVTRRDLEVRRMDGEPVVMHGTSGNLIPTLRSNEFGYLPTFEVRDLPEDTEFIQVKTADGQWRRIYRNDRLIDTSGVLVEVQEAALAAEAAATNAEAAAASIDRGEPNGVAALGPDQEVLDGPDQLPLSDRYSFADELVLSATRNGVASDGTTNDKVALAAVLAEADTFGLPTLMQDNTRLASTLFANQSVRIKGLPGAKITIDHTGNGIDIVPTAESIAGGVNAGVLGATTITKTGAAWATNAHVGRWVVVDSSPSETARRVLSNTSDTLTLEFPLGIAFGAATPANFYTPLDEVVIEGLTVDAGATHNNANLIVRYAKSVRMRNVRLLNAGDYAAGTGNGISIYHSDHVRLTDLEAIDSGNFGLFVYDCDDVRVYSPRVKHWGGQFGVQLKDCRDAKVIGAHVVGDGAVGDHAYNIKCSGLNPAYGQAVVDSFGSLSQGCDFEMSSIMEEGDLFVANDFAFRGCYSYKSDGSGFATVTDAESVALGIKGWAWESCTAVQATKLGFELPLTGMKIVNITARLCTFEGLSVDQANVRVQGALFEDNSQAYVSGATRSSEVLLTANAQKTILQDCEFRRTAAGKTLRAVRELAGADGTLIVNPRIVQTAAGYTADYVLSGAASKAVGRREIDTYTGGPTVNKVPYIAVAPAAANADTSGAVLADLETEVNQLKAVLRTAGLLTP